MDYIKALEKRIKYMEEWKKLRTFLATGYKIPCATCAKEQSKDNFYDPYFDRYNKRCNKCIVEGRKLEVVKKIKKEIIKKIKNKLKKKSLPKKLDITNKKGAVYNSKNRARSILKQLDIKKDAGELLGCTTENFVSYIETRFVKGMTWENYGAKGWHIDHIRPCASFDLTDIEQQKACFHYTNLQPLWARDNCRKGSMWRGIRFKYKNPIKTST